MGKKRDLVIHRLSRVRNRMISMAGSLEKSAGFHMAWHIPVVRIKPGLHDGVCHTLSMPLRESLHGRH